MTGGLPKELAEDLRELCLEIVPRGFVATLEILSTLMDKIREAQKTDKEIAEIKEEMSKGMLEICPRGNNKWLLLYFFVHDNCLLFML